MTDDLNHSCPPWCQRPVGHLHLEADGPGDFHTADIAIIDIPEIPDLRAPSPLLVKIEQYVTRTETYAAVISIDVGDGGEPGANENHTADEACASPTRFAKRPAR